MSRFSKHAGNYVYVPLYRVTVQVNNPSTGASSPSARPLLGHAISADPTFQFNQPSHDIELCAISPTFCSSRHLSRGASIYNNDRDPHNQPYRVDDNDDVVHTSPPRSTPLLSRIYTAINTRFTTALISNAEPVVNTNTPTSQRVPLTSQSISPQRTLAVIAPVANTNTPASQGTLTPSQSLTPRRTLAAISHSIGPSSAIEMCAGSTASSVPHTIEISVSASNMSSNIMLNETGARAVPRDEFLNGANAPSLVSQVRRTVPSSTVSDDCYEDTIGTRPHA